MRRGPSGAVFLLPPYINCSDSVGALCQLLGGFIWLGFSGLEGLGVVGGLDTVFADRGSGDEGEGRYQV